MPELSTATLEDYAHRMIAAVLERLCVPFLLIDGGGRVRFANELAEAILDDGRHLGVAAGKHIVPQSEQAAGEMQRFLGALGDAPEEIDMVLQSTDGGPPLFASASAFAPPVPAGFDPLPPLAVVFIREGDGAEGIEVAQQHFGLSGAETAVLAAVVAGTSVGEHARRRSISVHTARKQLSSAMRKVGVSRQNELALVVDTLAGRGRDRAAAKAQMGQGVS